MTSKATMNLVLIFSLHSAIIINHILASYPERVTQQAIIDVGLSDHQLIFCTGRNSKIKRGTHKHIKFRSVKQCSAGLFKETLTSINFPNYQNFNDVTEAYDDFIHKIMVQIDKVEIINNSQERIDGEISEAIKNRNKSLNRLHIYKGIT